eukprot:PhF_6_TR15494/c1_g1_i1/m.24108
MKMLNSRMLWLTMIMISTWTTGVLTQCTNAFSCNNNGIASDKDPTTGVQTNCTCNCYQYWTRSACSGYTGPCSDTFSASVCATREACVWVREVSSCVSNDVLKCQQIGTESDCGGSSGCRWAPKYPVCTYEQSAGPAPGPDAPPPPPPTKATKPPETPSPGGKSVSSDNNLLVIVLSLSGVGIFLAFAALYVIRMRNKSKEIKRHYQQELSSVLATSHGDVSPRHHPHDESTSGKEHHHHHH